MRTASINRKAPFLIFALSFLAVIQIAEYNRAVVVNRYDNEKKAEKVILAWTPFFGDYYYSFGKGKKAFEDHGCLFSNCYITDNRRLIPQHTYDAILFHGYEFYELFFGKPRNRSQRQLYVFMSLESAARNNMQLDNFYNLTMTYRLDSDIPWPYFKVRNLGGRVVAPSLNPRWLEFRGDITVVGNFAREKKKMAAWFVSNCRSTNRREFYAKELQKHTQVDIYGRCGDLQCSGPHCIDMLSRDYFFYIAFENSHCEDYITEKTFTALQSNTIPVIYSKVNLSRFLPPHSYIDASELSPKQLAFEMERISSNMTLYLEYFWWKRCYTVEKTMPGYDFPNGTHPFCELCRVLNQNEVSYDGRDIKKWWLGTEASPKCISIN